MNNYYDDYGRVHHKPCINGEPSSNNGWIYTAYLYHAKGEIQATDWLKLASCFEYCRVYYEAKGDYIINRHPGKSTIPISRDEILGLADLDLLKPEHLDGWNFSPYPLPRFSPLKLVKQLWEAKGEHRNYFWQNSLDQLYRFAFSVPVQDRAFILKKWGKFRWYNPVHVFYAAFGRVSSLFSPNGLDWLKYGGKRAEKEMLKEFPADHPVAEALK